MGGVRVSEDSGEVGSADPAAGGRPVATSGERPLKAKAAARRHVAEMIEAGEAEIAARLRDLEAHPSGSAAVELAQAYLRLGRAGPALAALGGRLQGDGDHPMLLAEGGRLLLRTGRYADAVRWLSRAAAALPDQAPELLRELRIALAGIEEDAERGAGPRGKALYLDGVELLIGRRFRQAGKTFAKAARLNPAHAPTWLGWRGALEAGAKAEHLPELEQAWRESSPLSQWAIQPVMSRALSRRGLLFDPREPLPIRPPGEALETVSSPAALALPGDAVLALDPGGEPYELEPIIPLASAPDQKTRFGYVTAPKYLAAIDNAVVAGRGLVINARGEIPHEVKLPFPRTKSRMRVSRRQLTVDPLQFRDGLCPVEVFDTPALLMTGVTDTSFGDWVLNFPPRLAIAAGAELDLPIVVRSGLPEPWLQMLEALGVPRRRLMFHDPAGVSLFPRLYVPSWPLPQRRQPMRGLFDIYGKLGLPAPGLGGERLYLSREGVSNRRLANEPEIRAAFERRGFRALRPERMGFEEARACFSQATVVAGAYGSAFLNLAAYASRPRGALVLMPPEADGFLSEVALWIGGSGSRFAYLEGKATGQPDQAWSLPVDQVEAALDELLQTIGERQDA